MIRKMADHDNDDTNNLTNGITITNHDKAQDFTSPDIDEAITEMFASSLLAPDVESLNDLESIAGEFSSLSNTIDELNKYLDKWDERHDQLRAHIREALQENEESSEQQEMDQTSQSVEASNDNLGDKKSEKTDEK